MANFCRKWLIFQKLSQSGDNITYPTDASAHDIDYPREFSSSMISHHFGLSAGLERSVPALWNDFMNGLSACQNTPIPFPSHGYDQAGEHVNRELKVDGGLIGVSNNINARTRFLLTAPLISSIYGEVCTMVNYQKTKSRIHHQNNEYFLMEQQKKVKAN